MGVREGKGKSFLQIKSKFLCLCLSGVGLRNEASFPLAEHAQCFPLAALAGRCPPGQATGLRVCGQ